MSMGAYFPGYTLTAMVAGLIIVPVVSLFTKRVEFEVDPPHVEGAIDREYEQELEAE